MLSPLESGLQEPLGHLLEQYTLVGYLQALGLRPTHELVDDPANQELRHHGLRRLDSLGLGLVVAGHRRIFHDRELRPNVSQSP
ncbi:hypothetical protein [Streptomyces sp. SH5]|uniref:hypothetical protein n=1 Tax=Streptomyces sp. SH5 TaxID=3041765 RepID=UPI0032B0560B